VSAVEARVPARGRGKERTPFLSVVVTARNDDHGGDLLYRMQVFVNALVRQCGRFGVTAELIVVEWNPPPDRPRLREALRWPDNPNVDARIIEVPHERHRRLRHSDRLPLFQMIAKNVGIRRARGRFVLATNIDLLFPDDLMRFLASGHLSERAVYRVDRHDVECRLEPEADVEEQLAACAGSVIRICGRDGTLDLRTGEFYAIYHGSARLPWWLSFWIRAWHYVRLRSSRRARRIVYLLTLPLRPRKASGALLRLLVRELRTDARVLVRLARTLDRVEAALAERRLRLALERRLVRRLRGRRTREAAPRPSLWPLAALAAIAGRLRDALARSRLVRAVAETRRAFAWERARIRLHTNASGDFTLMSRNAWFGLRAYPELEIFSMHIDGLLVYMAHWAGLKEVVLPYPIYHLEHSHGFKPDTEGLRHLNERLERSAIPQISNVQFHTWALEMWRTRRPLAFNGDDWGFGGERLEESVLAAAPAAQAEGRELVPRW
jgi:hypothetical protein